jgi:hypothetical protein
MKGGILPLKGCLFLHSYLHEGDCHKEFLTTNNPSLLINLVHFCHLQWEGITQSESFGSPIACVNSSITQAGKRP